MSKSFITCVMLAALCGGVSAETWYLKESNASSVSAINNLSYWTNSVGEVGSGAPTAADYQVVPADRTLREGSITSKAKSVTIKGKFTQDSPSSTWANDGMFIGPGGTLNLNTYAKAHSFSALLTITIDGKLTIQGTTASPTKIFFAQIPYSNAVYQVAKLIGAEGSKIRLQNASTNVVNNTMWVGDASAFNGDVLAEYTSTSIAARAAPRDNGEYGGRVGFTGLNTPGSLEIGPNWTLGAESNGVTTAASITLGAGSRVEVALSETGVSRVVATTALSVADGVQIFLTSRAAGRPFAPGRYPILTAPTAIDGTAFTLKKGPDCATICAELETDFADGVGTLYLKVSGYRTLYVDANYGDDAWDGTTNAIPSAETIAQGGAIPGPKKTLAAVMAIAGPDDTVKAAEGVYDQGEMYSSSSLTSNRVIVAEYVTLEAAGAQANTIIAGKISTDAGNWNGCWSNAVRCVGLNKGSVVKGFTLKDGRTCNGSSDNAHNDGGAVWGVKAGGMVVDCVITNCGAAKRSATSYGPVTLLRCRVEKPACNGDALDFCLGAKVIDSIICHTGGAAYRKCEFVNCTFPSALTIYGNGVEEKGIMRNCLHLYVSSSAFQSRYSYIYNSYFCSVKLPETHSLYPLAYFDEQSRFKLTVLHLPVSAGTYRPALTSIAIGKGDLEMYLAVTNGWEYTLQRQFTMKDIYGTDRLNGGALDLGAVQHREMSRYVDAAHGNDANDGLTAATAKRTLKAITDAVVAGGDYEGTVIHAAPGTYDEGATFYANCSNRVVVPKAVGLVADQGPTVTTIKGQFGDLANKSKAGAAAVRCVYLMDCAWVKGFKITGGATQKHATKNTGLYGGGVYGVNGGIIACEITDNAGGGEDDSYFRGPGGFGGTYIGCYVHDNYGSFQIYHYGSSDDQVVNTVLLGTSTYYGSECLLNCSSPETSCNAMHWNSNQTWAVNCYFKGSGRGRTYTNCYFRATTFDYNYSSANTNSAGEKLPSADYDSATCRFGVEPAFDANNLPLPSSVFVDAGSQALYEAHFPEKWAYFKDVGFLGQQRVYNGVIDVGGSEYDVRGDLAQTLNANRRLTVEAVSANVTTNAAGVALSVGDAIEMTFQFKASGTAHFTVTGDVTVTVDGVVLTPVNGVYAVTGVKGTNRVVKVTNHGSTSATLSTCDIPLNGVYLLLR